MSNNKDKVTGKGLVIMTRMLLIYIQVIAVILSCGFFYYSTLEWRATQEAKAEAAKIRITNAAELKNVRDGKIIKPEVIFVPTIN